MTGRDWRSALNAGANVAVIAASAAVLLSVWTNLGAIRRAEPAVPPRPVALVSGARAPTINGVDYARSDRTLLLFMSVHCRYCQESVPFYRELATSLETTAGKGRKRRVLAVFREGVADVNEFEDRENFRAEAVAGYDFRVFGVSATPTMVLLSKDGRVLQVWHGSPNKQAQEAIRNALLSSWR